MGSYRAGLAGVAVGLFFTNVSNYTERWGLIPLVWIGLYAGLCVPVAVAGLVAGRFAIPPLAWWGGGYLIMSVLGFYRSPQDDFPYEEVQQRVLSVLFLVLSLVVFADGRAQVVGRMAIAGATVLAAMVNLYELFNPQAFSTVIGRAAGLYVNPNQSAAALVLGLILGHGVVRPGLRVPFVVVTGLGIIPTFSRSGILAWLLVVAFFTLRAEIGLAQIRRVVALAALVIGVLASPLWDGLERELAQRGTLTLNVLDRLAFFGGGNADDASTEERTAVAGKAWELVGEEPLQGHGTGTSLRIEGFTVGTHNMYLTMMVDHGFPVGVLVIPLLVLATLWGAGRETRDLTAPFAAFVALWSLFSHNVLEERYILLAVGLTASVVAVARHAALTHGPSPEVARGEIALAFADPGSRGRFLPGGVFPLTPGPSPLGRGEAISSGAQ